MHNINYPGEICLAIYHVIKHNPSLVFRAWRIGLCIFTLLSGFCIFYSGLFRPPFERKPSFLKQILGNPKFFVALMITGLIFFRIPNLVSPQQNPDEGQYIASAATVYHGNVFWRDVGGVHGPLITMPFCLMKILGFGFNYTSGRIFGLFCIVVSIFFLWKTFSVLYNETLARIIVIPFTLFFACGNHYDMVAYDSEHVPMLLTAISLFLFLTLNAESKGVTRVICLGFMLGLFPWAKLQTVYIGLAIGFLAIFDTIFTKGSGTGAKLKMIFSLCFAALVPSVLAFAYIIVNSAFAGFWQDTIVWPLLYSKVGFGHDHFSGLAKIFLGFQMLKISPDLRYYFTVCFSLVVLFVGYGYIKYKQAFFLNKRLIYLFFILAIAYFTVVFPGNNFPHYLILFVVPFTFCLGAYLGEFHKRSNGVSFERNIFIPYILILLVYLTLEIRSEPRGIYFVESGGDCKASEISRIIMKYTRLGEKMSIWGWEPRYYVETGLIQANYSAALNPVYFALDSSKLTNPNVERYINEMRRNKPVIFLDAVAPESFFYDDTSTMRHELFPKLDDLISEEYRLVASVKGNRLYVLNKRVVELGY